MRVQVVVAIWGLSALVATSSSFLAAKTSDRPLNTAGTTTIAAITGDLSMTSTLGKDLVVHSFPPKTKAVKLRFLVQGGVHGNEPISPKFVTWLAKRYADGESPLNAFAERGVAIDFFPSANPDGVAEQSRYNARGVNLNRNFSVLWGTTRENPGEAAFSERESQAIRALFAKRRYDASIDVHGYINWIVAPTPPGEVGLTDVKSSDQYERWFKALKTEMRMLPNYDLHTAGGLGDGGAFEDWAFWSQGSLSACLEIISDTRFDAPYRPLFNDPRERSSLKTADSYKRYEMFIARVFERALAIKTGKEPDKDLAAE